jgi:hypothetical protein
MKNIYEKLGFFYLGKTVNPETAKLQENFLLYDSKDLLTHAVCVGMTGSGKTGLGVALLEEAAIDNIPSIIIDPKGDMGNLLLTFPDLQGKDFLPWINIDEANNKGLSPEEYADQQADLWKNGLAKWEEDGQRIAAFKSAAEFVIYTPGSSAGWPVSIVKSFSAPSRETLEDMDLLHDRIQTTSSGILELLGIKVDPLQSREHILLSNIIEHAWSRGEDLDLGSLIQKIQSPPLSRIGVFDLESFYPSSERFKLSMTFNNLLAAPGFKIWMEGEPLDIGKLIYTTSGKPRILIFSIAHLSDSERMFFVSLLLNQILGWIRTQSGTTSLRAVLYMDEVFGFLPPVGEPPSKRPLLTLLKQARAYGLGVVLATQNPVDLDYKALSNIGSWFIGRLQTERDKERLADGLTSARGESGSFTKSNLKKIISGLEKRQFLLHNVHDNRPQLFNTRWVLSYLCGPLTRNQIKTLKEKQPIEESFPESTEKASLTAEFSLKREKRPQIRPEIRQYFAPVSGKISSEKKIHYYPYLLGAGEIKIVNNSYGVAHTTQIAHVLELKESLTGFRWEDAQTIPFDSGILFGEPIEQADYLPLPTGIIKLSTYDSLDKQYENFLYRNFQIQLYQNNLANMTSQPGESERDFRIRINQTLREQRDLEMERLKRRYAGKLDTLERQLLAAQQRVDQEATQYEQKKMDAALSLGTGLLGALFGSKRKITTGVDRATRSASRLSKEKKDIQRAQEKLAVIQERMAEVEKELETEIQRIADEYDVNKVELQQIILRPKKTDILQKYFGIFWIPFNIKSDGSLESWYPELKNKL